MCSYFFLNFIYILRVQCCCDLRVKFQNGDKSWPVFRSLSPYPPVFLPLGERLARGFVPRESRGRKRERAVEAPAPAIDSLGYIRGFKSYYHQRNTRGCHQWRTAPRPRTRSSRVSPFGPRQDEALRPFRLIKIGLEKKTKTKREKTWRTRLISFAGKAPAT